MKRSKRPFRPRKGLPINQMDLFEALPSTRLVHASKALEAASARRRATTQPPASVLLDVRQAAARLGLSKSTLDKMRCRGAGPKFVKSTDRAVRYDPKDLDAWVEARRRQSTGQ
jgi:predicted DNA-binding transcriptional regulator AlpA